MSDETAGHYDVSLALPRNPGAVALARDFAAAQLVKAGYLGRHDEIVLAVSELVTNALTHGGSAPTMRLTGNARRTRIEVADDSPVLPRQQDEFGPQGGWGLTMIGRMAAWGAFRRGPGKVVWCEATLDSSARGTVELGLAVPARESGVPS